MMIFCSRHEQSIAVEETFLSLDPPFEPTSNRPTANGSIGRRMASSW